MEPELMIAELPAVAPLTFVEARAATPPTYPAPQTRRQPAESLTLERVVTSLQVMLAVRRAARNAARAARRQ
jgi:hypothetical protein